MKNSKVLPTFFKALVCIFSLVTVTLFFFEFVKAGNYTFTGFQAAFGSTQKIGGKDVNTYKSAWYLFAFILSALTLVFSAVNFKVKGAKYASFGFSIASFINMCVIYFANPVTKYFDNRYTGNIKLTGNITTQLFFMLTVIAAGVVMVLATISMLVSDSAEVKLSNGTKITIPRRIKRFFKDYKREIKNIVWPSRNTVLKNFLVVLAMCAVVGAYIWLLDLGLAKLLDFVLGLKG